MLIIVLISISEYKDKTINEVYEEERSFLVSAPIIFDGCKEVEVKVSITCLARYDNNNYSVHCSCAGAGSAM